MTFLKILISPARPRPTHHLQIPAGIGRGLCDESFAATERSSDPTTADPSRRDPIPKIQSNGGSHPTNSTTPLNHQSEVDRTGAVERIS